MVGPDGEVIRIIGTLSDVTEGKVAEERLLHDAVHDNPHRPAQTASCSSTGSRAALTFAGNDPRLRPTVFCIDVDRFKQINEGRGPVGRRLDPADAVAAAVAPAQAAGQRSPGSRATSSRPSCCRRTIPTRPLRSPTCCAVRSRPR